MELILSKEKLGKFVVIAIPSAIQNEINEKDAEMLVDVDCKFIVEALICHAQKKQYRYLMIT